MSLNRDTAKAAISRLAVAFRCAQAGIDKLCDVYCNALAERITDQQLLHTVEFLLLNGDRFPTIKDFLEVARANSGVQSRKEATACATCDGSGVIRAVDAEGYKPIFKCPHCDNSNGNYPVWGMEWERRGYSRIMPTRWDAEDVQQVKGLALLGSDSISARKAPHAILQRATEMLAGGWKPRPGTLGAAMHTKPDRQREIERDHSLREDARREESAEEYTRRMIANFNASPAHELSPF